MNELGVRVKFEEEVRRFNRFQRAILGERCYEQPENIEANMRTYAKYVLTDGTMTEKRELLGNLRSKVVYKDKKITLLED